MNIFDIGIILILIMSFIVGFKKGIIKEAVSFIGIVLVLVLSFSFKSLLGNFFCKVLPFITFAGNVKGITALNILFYQLLAFLILYIVLTGVYSFILKVSKFLQKIINFTIVLWLPSSIGGGIIGLLSGYLTIFVVLLLILIPFKDNTMFKESTMINTIMNKTPIIAKYSKNISNSVTEIYDLEDEIVNNKLSINEANLKTIDIMLKYNIASKELIESLRQQGKLKDITNLDSILQNY